MSKSRVVGILALAFGCVAEGLFAAGLSAAHYVQDGLKSCFDGIDNEATGVHNASAAVWKDLKGTATLAKASYGFWGANHFNTGTNTQKILNMPVFGSYSITMNLAVNLDYIARTEGTSTTWPSLISAGNVSFHGTGNSAREFRWFINGSEPRINSGIITTNTLTGTSDGYAFRIYRDGAQASSVLDIQHNANNTVVGSRDTSTTWTLTPPDSRDGGKTQGRISARFYGIRAYDRAITADEAKYNNAIDRIRFWDGRITGDGTTSVAWSNASWASPEGVAKTVPATDGNAVAAVDAATAAVAASDGVNLYALSLENGGQLSLASDAIVATRFLFVENVRIARGVYTGTGAVGTQVSWLAGEGVVRVADSYTADIPESVAVKGADGWYEFGLKTGYQYNNNVTFVCAYVDLGKYVFEPNAKLRLVGGLILNEIPDDTFAEIDTSGIGYVVFNEATVRADGLPFEIPAGATARYQPGPWIDQGDNTYKLSNAGSSGTFTGDLVVNGTLTTSGDHAHYTLVTFTGHVTGSGTLVATSFNNQNRWSHPIWGFGGSLKAGSNATLLWLEPETVTNALQDIWIHHCADQAKYRTNTSYCCSGVAFGPRSSDTASPAELRVKTLSSATVTAEGQTFTGASDYTDLQGKRWINGGTILVWGGNTVHVETLQSSLHVVARRQDQQCLGQWFASLPTFGTGAFVADRVTGGSNLFLSTNITSVVIGSIAGASCLDYSFQSGNINRATLDITNGCAATASVKATDLAMLPARLSGFAGTVTLTETATRSYTIPVDFSAGPTGLCQTVGCIGSGTLAAAPAAGTIDAIFDASRTAAAPEKGDYALARFTAGGEKLAGWTVTLNGQAVPSVLVRAMTVSVRKDSTGLYLAVRRGGATVIVR